MGKRSNFNRLARDSYDPAYSAVIPLLSHLSINTKFSEPCAGKNALVQHLQMHGHKCLLASDVHPRGVSILNRCVFEQSFHSHGIIITNPLWDRKILHPLIEKVIEEERKAWLLFDADQCHTKQSIPFMPHVASIVSLGRVKWIEGSQHTGKDNCAWHKFGRSTGNVVFHGRT